MKRPYRWDEGLRLRVLGLVVFLLSLLVGLGTILSYTFDELSRLQLEAEQSRKNVTDMEAATSILTETSAAVRAYLLTGDESFLSEYYPRLNQMERILAELELRSASNPAQVSRVREIQDLIQAWREQVVGPEIALKQVGSPDVGRLITTSEVSYIEQIRQKGNEYIQDESRRMTEELESASRAADRVREAAWMGVVAAAALSLTGVVVLARSVTRSITALTDAAHRIAEGERKVLLDKRLAGELQIVAEAFNAMSMTLAEQEKRLQSQQEELLTQNEDLMAHRQALQMHAAELERQERRLSRLHQLSSKMVGTIEIDQLGQIILDEYLDLYGGAAGALLLVDEAGRFHVQAERWLAPGFQGAVITRTGPLARCIEKHEVVMARYPETFTRLSVWQTEVPVVQEAYVPLVHTGRVIGVVVVAFTEPPPENPEAEALWEHVAGQASVALAAALGHLEVKRSFAALQEQAAQIEMLNAQLEEERDRASAQLGIYLSIVSTMRAGAWLCDPGGQLLVVNATFREFFGQIPDDAPAEQVLAQIASFLPEDDPFPPLARRLIRSAEESAEGRIRLSNGYVLQWSSAPVGSGSSRVGRLFTFQDVTELAELDRMKSEFVNTVSHELRTPLTSIMGYLSLVLGGAVGPLQEQQREFLNVVHRNTVRLSNLINDLLDIQRIESGRIPIQKSKVDLAQLAQQAAETFRVQAEQKGLKLELLAVPEEVPLVEADPDRVLRIISNLLSNAIKYTKKGWVRVTVQKSERTLDLIVEDTGIGISRADQKRIFDRFYRAVHPYVREVGGTGLGLPIVQKLVEEMGGEVKVESTLGKGSRFTVCFPLPQQES